jgi:phage-related protein (TIGR01555 family)
MDSELLAMFNGNALAARIVKDAPVEMFRRGWEVRSSDLSSDDLKRLDKKAAALRLNEIMLEGTIWGRLFGGALNLIGAEDGQNPDMPLDTKRIRTIHYANVVDRRFVWVQRYYSDVLSPKYGLPEIYLVTNVVSSGGAWGGASSAPLPGNRLAAVSVHESRTIRYDGAETDVLTRQQLAGWTWPVLQRCYDVLRRFEGAQNSVDNLLSDASQAVYKVKDLVKMIAQNQKESVISRMQLVDFSRSSLRAIMVDAEAEDFKREPTTFTGIPELIDRQKQLVAMCAEEPVTRLFGQSPAGLNATGESDVRLWLDQIRSKQENELGPKINLLYRLMGLAADSGIKVDDDTEFKTIFRPLWEPTEMESADRGLKIAQRDQILIAEKVITPDEAKLGLFGSGRMSDWIDVDAAALSKAIEAAPRTFTSAPAPEGALVNAAQQGESQSPVVPLPLPGAVDLQGAARNRGAESPQRRDRIDERRADHLGIERDPRYDSASIALAVHHQMSEDYPEDLLGWVESAQWKGPIRIPLAKIDFTDSEKWSASHDPVHVGVMKTRIEQGLEKPLILVREPGSKLLFIVDGHHRALAYRELDKNARGYIARVPTDKGPWSALHSQQKEGLYGSSQKNDSDDQPRVFPCL